MTELRVSVVGAGALGAVYGLALAEHGVSVSFVGRRSREVRLAVERVGSGERRERVVLLGDAVDPRADVVLLTVRTQEAAAVVARVPETVGAVISLTPLMPRNLRECRLACRVPLLTAMPSVIAYARGDVVRYWLPRAARTRIDEPRGPAPVVRSFAEALSRAGIGAGFDVGMSQVNPATTCAMIVPMMGMCAAGSLSELASSAPHLELTARATREAAELARHLGRAEPWAQLLADLMTPLALRAAARLVRGEPRAYVEAHFGPKLRDQHLEMAHDLVALGGVHRCETGALRELEALLAAS